ncbi:MAG: methylenetetrahydrofolate reductase [Candidatus Omnitrophica bacterium]|nr:methylenetetrahydrofolate reductase [Candidatus Omnitrophota bacterium]
MRKITDIFKSQPITFSCEIFPPKTEQGYENLKTTISEWARLKPDFISCTYGAGGGNREKTLDIVQLIQNRHQIAGLAHLTCVLNTKQQIREIVEDIKRRGVRNILALRGDPPLDNPNWQPGENNFRFSKDLCADIRLQYGDFFSIGAAGFPEGHILCKDRDRDAGYLKNKIENGAEFVITQFFFDNADYFAYVERLRRIGVTARVIPGLLPITNYENMIKFCKMNGTTITPQVKQIFEPIQNDPSATLKAGIAFAIQQSRALLKGGAPGLHFYCLNKIHPTQEIWEAVL